MKLNRLTLALVGALALSLGAAACGGSGNVPSGSVAVVNGTDIPRSDLDALIERAKKGYAAQKQSFPKEGTQEYQSVQSTYLNYLVQKTEFEQAAKDLGVTVSDKDVDKALTSFVTARFAGKQADFEKALQEQGFTVDQFKDTLRVSVLSQKIFEAVTKNVKVGLQDVLAYYSQNASQYIDYAKSKAKADQLYTQLKAGADFATLVKKYSADPGSKDSGGKYTDTKGQFAPEFEAVAFKLATGEISKPVKTQFGYHIIQALSAVKAGPPETRVVRHILIAEKQPLSQVKSSIRATLLQNKRNQVMTTWVEDLTKRYQKKVTYATGFAPPELPSTTTTTATQ
jgi:foldase protein PrsA